MTVAVVPAPGGAVPAHPSVAFAISRKVGNSVVRNRLRRRLRDEVDGLVRDQRLAAAAYLIALAPAATTLDSMTLRGHLRSALGISA